MTSRPRLTPAVADVRRYTREALQRHGISKGDFVLVAVSGGPDSLALASALAFEAGKLEIRYGAIVVDHKLQANSHEVAETAATRLKMLGYSLVKVQQVTVGNEGGMEAAARTARYLAIDELAAELDAKFVLLGHTKNDQAETVLLGLARGSGARSLSGMNELTGRYLRPLLALGRDTTVAACTDAGIEFWEDPHNTNEEFARVKVRQVLLPMMEEQLGPGIVDALSRTSDQLREDVEVLDHLAEHAFQEVSAKRPTSIDLDISKLLEKPIAIRLRVYRIAADIFGSHLHRSHVLEIDRLITDWHGQKALAVPGVRVERLGENISLKSTKTLKPGAC